MATHSQIVPASEQLPRHPSGLVRPGPQGPALILAPPKPAVAAPELTDLRKMFDESRAQLDDPRKAQEKDRDYYDGPEQLNSDVRAVLKMRGQPEIYTNRVRPAIDGILGVLEGSRVDPRCYPRNPTDDNAADVATKTLRFIADKARFDETKLDCAETFLIEGECAAIIEGDAEDVTVKQIRWEEFFFDPRSRRPDFKDAAYLGFAKWISMDTVAGMFSEKWAEFGSSVENGVGASETWGDRPFDMSQWVDRKQRRVLIVTLFHVRGGEWMRCVYCSAGVLEYGPTGYADDKGRSLCPIEAASCYVDKKNRRYGRVRDMVPIQDEINARRSRLLHLANSRQIQEIAQGAAMVDAETARAEASRSDGVIPTGWQLVPTADLASGQAMLMQESKSEIDRMGPTPAVLGRSEGSSQSGRSRMVLQQAGMTELARPLGRFSEWENRVYRQMFWRAKQFWQAPMWIRVTDDLKAPEFIQVNEPVMGQVMQQMQAPDGSVIQVPGIGPVGAKNRLADLDMDIIVETVPEQANLQSEVFGEMIELVRGGIDPFSPHFELLIEMSPLADKARILERVKGHREKQAEAAQAQQQAQQVEMEAAMAERVAKVEKTQAETAKLQTETMISGFEAGMGSVPDPASYAG